MKEKIKKLVFYIPLIAVIYFFIEVITPKYCIVREANILSSEHCIWQYTLSEIQRLGFALAFFLSFLFIRKIIKEKNK